MARPSELVTIGIVGRTGSPTACCGICGGFKPDIYSCRTEPLRTRHFLLQPQSDRPHSKLWATQVTGDMSCFIILAEARIQLSCYENRIMIHRLQVLRPQLDARFREHDRYIPGPPVQVQRQQRRTRRAQSVTFEARRFRCHAPSRHDLLSVTPAQAGGYVHSHPGKAVRDQLGTLLKCGSISILQRLEVIDSRLLGNDNPTDVDICRTRKINIFSSPPSVAHFSVWVFLPIMCVVYVLVRHEAKGQTRASAAHSTESPDTT